jgi:hypothetical protein
MMAVRHAGTRNGRASRRMPRLPAVFLAYLSGLAGTLGGCSEPPPPAAEYPLAAPPAGTQRPPVVGAENRCGLVKRAKRTWVEFGPGMTPDDMVPAGFAAGAVVRALDIAVCALLQRGQPVPVLQRYSAQLKAQAADCGGFEVTKVLWQDGVLAHAHVELHGLAGAVDSGWLASLVKQKEAWRVASFAHLPL